MNESVFGDDIVVWMTWLNITCESTHAFFPVNLMGWNGWVFSLIKRAHVIVIVWGAQDLVCVSCPLQEGYRSIIFNIEWALYIWDPVCSRQTLILDFVDLWYTFHWSSDRLPHPAYFICQLCHHGVKRMYICLIYICYYFICQLCRLGVKRMYICLIYIFY